MDNNISAYSNQAAPSRGINFKSPEKTQKKISVAGDLDKDAFLKLLVTELRHQDPTQPMENKEFISQMAQFSALEQMTNVNKSIQSLNRSSRAGEAFSLLGKNVKAFDPLSGKKVEGVVTSIFYKNDEIRLVVGNKEIGLNDIHSVSINEQATSNVNNIINKKTEGINENSINTSKDIKNNNDIKKAENQVK